MRKKTAEIATITAFLLYLVGFLLLQICWPDREFSPRENRYLQTLPPFSLSALFSGELTADLKDYCADQFPFRDEWITMNAHYEQLSGKKQTNGVYLCEGERLIKPFIAPSESELWQRVAAVEQLSGQLDVPLALGLIPDSAELYRELLPSGAPNDSQQELIEKIRESAAVTTADLLTPLRVAGERGEYIFYRTDHHWTTLGAYYGYTGLCSALGLEAQPIDRFNVSTVAENFYGTAYSASGYTWIAPDRIERYVEEEAAADFVRYDSSEPVHGSIYREESLTGRDKYTYFLGGNVQRSVLYGTDSTLPRLLLLRDSYSDALAPFLLAHYSEIHMLDLRYYLGSPAEYVEENHIDQVLVLYSVSNFCQEKSVLALGE